MGLLAVRHEAHVAHVRDGATGTLHHAHALADVHAQDASPHLHGRHVEAHAEIGGCLLHAALDQSTLAPTLHAAARAVFSRAVDVPLETDARVARLARYRLAPKTSPPTIA